MLLALTMEEGATSRRSWKIKGQFLPCSLQKEGIPADTLVFGSGAPRSDLGPPAVKIINFHVLSTLFVAACYSSSRKLIYRCFHAFDSRFWTHPSLLFFKPLPRFPILSILMTSQSPLLEDSVKCCPLPTSSGIHHLIKVTVGWGASGTCQQGSSTVRRIRSSEFRLEILDNFLFGVVCCQGSPWDNGVFTQGLQPQLPRGLRPWDGFLTTCPSSVWHPGPPPSHPRPATLLPSGPGGARLRHKGGWRSAAHVRASWAGAWWWSSLPHVCLPGHPRPRQPVARS